MRLTPACSQPIAYDILSVYGQIPTPGLLDNMVYDLIPALPTARGAAFVNASLYDVDCGYLAVKQADPIGAAQRIIIDNSTPDTKSLVMPSFELPCTSSGSGALARRLMWRIQTARRCMRARRRTQQTIPCCLRRRCQSWMRMACRRRC